MRNNLVENRGSQRSQAQPEERDYKWAVEWLVKQQGQREAAKTLGVNRKTVASALRRERLTPMMNDAVQTLIARLEDPVNQEALPLDRINSQISFLLESMGELDDLIEELTMRVESLEEAMEQVRKPVEAESQVEPEADDDAMVHGDEGAQGQKLGDESSEGQGPELQEQKKSWWPFGGRR